MIRTSSPLPPTTRAMQAWDEKTEAYLYRWPMLNRVLERRGFELMPNLPVEAVIHIAGVGGGQEILPLVRLYPANTIFASDLSGQMVRASREKIAGNPREFPVLHLQADLHAPPVQGVHAAISLFTLHLVRDPVLALSSQWESLASGGLLAALYFPPEPVGDEGPLVSLYDAMRKIQPKPPSPWEENALRFLGKAGALELERREVRSFWRYDSLDDVRPTFEALPHIAAIRHRLGDEMYEEFWRHFHDNPGVVQEKDSYVGRVGAILLTARKP
ncbi:class I SAM-dependent methyltransferase [bacterium]|nr:class I SAM-dependent methyltransferase [bacterium]